MKGASVLRPLHASRLVPGGVAVVALAIAIAASVWHQRPALAQTATTTTASAPWTTAANRDPSLPSASQVLAARDLADAPIFEAPTY